MYMLYVIDDINQERYVNITVEQHQRYTTDVLYVISISLQA